MGPSNVPKHFVPDLFPRAPEGDPRWGAPLPPLGSDREVTIIGPSSPFTVPVSVQKVEITGEQFGACWERWGGLGNAQYVLPEAFTTNVDRATLELMYALDRDRPSQHPIGSFKRLDEYVTRFSPGDAAVQQLFEQFRPALDAVPSGSIVNWQFYMFAQALPMFGADLKARGVIQTFTCHDPIPDNLHESEFGRQFLRSLSEMGAVYVHTDRYARNLENSLAILNLPIPLVKRMDLGMNSEFIANSLATVTPSNFKEVIPNFYGLPPRQQAFAIDAVASAAIGPDGEPRVAHRYISFDRLDPMKGSPSMFEGIGAFLQDRLDRGASLDDLRRNFRFYIIDDQGQRFASNPELRQKALASPDLSTRYVIRALDSLNALQERFPGVVFVSEPFYGTARPLLPLLMRGCHLLTGGASEGLNLAVSEGAIANRDLDTTVVAGNNAGISIRLRELGLDNEAFFPQPGSAASFRDAFAQITAIKEGSRGVLGDRKSRLVNYLLTRSDSLLTAGEELL